jgi:class 3 adenylate cyclase
VRASGEHLKSATTDGRFDEASQRDVLALAARLQKQHFDTMSASEIEQAAIEGGLNAEFVREAIRRVSSDEEKSHEAEPTKVSSSEWAVVIVVPTVVFGALFLRYLAHNENFTRPGKMLAVLALGMVGGLLYLAGLGIRSLAHTKRPRPSLNSSFSLPQTMRTPMNLGSFALHGLAVLTLATMAFSERQFDQAIFMCVLMPFVGGLASRLRIAFWEGAAFGALVGLLGWFGDFSRGRLDLGALPIYIAGFGAVYGILSLAGYGLKRLFTKTMPSTAHHSVDRSEMLAQLFELQATLERHQETRTFLSIDVVGSSAMKTSSSELEAEHSFRQYQTWVAETVRGFGGEVQLSAGDGAMAMFKDPSSAVAAAKRLQGDMGEFNANKNRLTMPFQIRCGIAEGKIGIDSRTPLGQIQSPVLDRAAFLQKYAEPGSVMVTRELLESAMPVLGSLHQRDLIDGKPVHTWP